MEAHKTIHLTDREIQYRIDGVGTFHWRYLHWEVKECFISVGMVQVEEQNTHLFLNILLANMCSIARCDARMALAASSAVLGRNI